MQYLSEKEWIFLNEITHMIYETDDMDAMRENLLDLLMVLIPNNCSSFYLANTKGEKLLTKPVANNICQKDIDNYLAFGEKMDYTMPIFTSGRPIAYKETDLFEARFRENTEFYSEFLSHGLEYPLALCIAEKGVCYGALSLYRSKKMGDFSERDIFVLEQLHKHLITKIKMSSSENPFLGATGLAIIKEKLDLTDRELEIVGYLLDGLSNEEIAKILFIELGTVKKHIHNIYRKADVKNRVQLFRMLR